ncbi:MAG: hypothetical protein NTX15_11230 [Candidatus Kapabacteria bacterium]|nr:hypothetical protein [Candidatus Kapabacteria bacterium]
MTLVLRVLVVMISFASAIEVHSQPWQRDPMLTLSAGPVGTANNATFSSLLVDTCTKQVYAFTGNRVLVSASDGRTWFPVEMPDHGKNYYKTLQFSASACNIVAYWDDKVGADVFRVVLLDQTGWREIRPDSFNEWGQGVFYVVSRRQVIVVDSRLSGSSDSILVSTNLGKEWTKYYVGTRRGMSEYHIYDVNESEIGFIASDSSVYEINVVSGAVIPLNTPARTRAHIRIGDKGIVASVRLSSEVWGIEISNDDSKTWQLLDTLRFVNSDTVLESITRRDQFAIAWWLTTKRGHLLVGFKTGAIVSTDADLSTWQYHGSTTGGVDLRRIVRMKNGEIVLITERGRATIDTNLSLSMTLTDVPKFFDVVTTQASQFVGITSNSLYFSSDSGRTWVLSAPVQELLDVSKDPVVGYHWPSIERIAKVSNDTVMVMSRDHGSVFSRIGNAQWSYSSVVYGIESVWPLLQFADLVNDRGRLVYWDVTSFATRSSDAIRVYDRYGGIREIYRPTDYNNEISSCVLLTDSTYFVVDKTIQRSTDAGRSWIACGAGWPQTTEGTNAPFLSAIRLRTGKLVFTLAGRREIVDGDSVVTYPGGILISSDNGKSVEHITTASLGSMFVHSAYEIDDDHILLSMSNIARQSGATSWDQTNAYVACVKLSDRSITYSFVESRTAPFTQSTMPIKRVASGDILVGTTQSGILRSRDNGQTWMADPEETLVDVPILDIAEDSKGVLYVATDRGLYTKGIVSHVSDGELGSAYASVWCYPTPTQDVVTVRLNNLNLVESTNLRLEVIDISGQHILDLTDWARTARSTNRTEFPLVVQNLSRGLYYFVLSHSKARESFPMMIVH